MMVDDNAMLNYCYTAVWLSDLMALCTIHAKEVT